jgi:hypothetical protein
MTETALYEYVNISPVIEIPEEVYLEQCSTPQSVVYQKVEDLSNLEAELAELTF